MLRLEGVAKTFGGIQAAVDVDLEVKPAEICGLIGPNGAGKTTIVNLITGILKLNGGRVFLDEVDISTESIHQIARRGVARTFQNIRLLPRDTVLDNVVAGFHRRRKSSWAADMLGLPSARREQKAMEDLARQLLARFNMEQYAGHAATGLSYGHQRRVEFMRALAMAPRLLILDEPVAGMNDVEAEAMGRMFTELADQGTGVLLIEHNIRFVASICSTVNVLNMGRLIASGRPNDVLRNPAVVEAYVGT